MSVTRMSKPTSVAQASGTGTPPSAPAGRMASEKRVSLLYTVLACVAAAAGGAWFAGTQITSPAEIAIRAAPPTPSPILVPIERKVLSSDVVTRGTVRFGLPQPIALAPSPLKSGPGLITSLPLRNTPIREGDVLLTASGRPVFVLQGQVPAYRDMAPRVSGEDVRQLEEGLSRLGFNPGRVDGLYDQDTSEAVARWYRAKGWDPFGPTVEQVAALRALDREWHDAVRARASAAAAVSTAGIAVEAARAAAVHASRVATVESATRATEPARPPTAQANPTTLAVEAERAKAEHANKAAEADVAAAIADRAIIVLDPRQTETARAAANARMEVAQAARDRIRLEGEMAVRLSEREASLSSDRAALGRSAQRAAQLEGARSVQVAQDARALAVLDLEIATDRAQQLARDVETSRQRIGMQVPIDEIVFIRNLPVRIEEVTATIGGAASGPLMTVTDNQLAIDAALPLDAASLVKSGMPVRIDEEALGIKATGSVDTIAATPGTRNVDRFHVYMSVKVETTTVPLEGASVRLTIPTESTKGAVLAVPISALSLSSDGTSRIQIDQNGALEFVTVQPGLSANGYVEVTPVSGTLTQGQMVVVGYNNPAGREAR